jgi:hypothetical protein
MSANATRQLAAVMAVTSLAMLVSSIVFLIPNAAGRPLTDLGPNGVGGMVLSVTYPIVGWLIVSRRPGNRIGWIILIVGLSQSLEGISEQYAVYALVTNPGSLPYADIASWVGVWAWVPGYMMLVILVLLFPDGELVSPRWRPLLWAAGLAFLLILVPRAGVGWSYRGPQLLPDEWGDPADGAAAIASLSFEIGIVLSLLVALAVVASVVVRFRRSTGIERQQLKWVGAAGLAEIAMLWVTTGHLVPSPYDMFIAAVIAPLVPVAIGISILRYRLYEIDRIVSRTIAYAVVTGLLAAAFAAIVLVLQAALASFTQGETVAVAASTLAVFALFQPLLRGVRQTVDRRFNRAHYDAQRTIDTFSARLRDEVDLLTLREALVTTATGAVDPLGAGVWLRPQPERR